MKVLDLLPSGAMLTTYGKRQRPKVRYLIGRPRKGGTTAVGFPK